MKKSEEEVEQISDRFAEELKGFTYAQVQTVSYKIMCKSAEIAIVS